MTTTYALPDYSTEHMCSIEAWWGLREYLVTAHRALSADFEFEGMKIGLGDAIELRAESRAELWIGWLHAGSPTRLYSLRVTFDYDLLFLRYEVSGDPIERDCMAYGEGYDREFGFRTRDGRTMTPEELGRSMMACLTSCAPVVWPIFLEDEKKTFFS
jgi:hypothetical protein